MSGLRTFKSLLAMLKYPANYHPIEAGEMALLAKHLPVHHEDIVVPTSYPSPGRELMCAYPGSMTSLTGWSPGFRFNDPVSKQNQSGWYLSKDAQG